MAETGDIDKDDLVPGLILSKVTLENDSEEKTVPFHDKSKIKVYKPGNHKPEDHSYQEYAPKIVYGYFSWDPQRSTPTNYGLQADLWLRLGIEYRSNVAQASKKLLLGPFLFQQPTVPNKWNKWAAKLNMLKATFEDTFTSFPNNSGKILREQYLACRLIDLSFNLTFRFMTSQRMPLINMLEMSQQINEKSDLEAVLKVYGTHDKIKKLADSIKNNLETWISHQDSHYLDVKKRRVFAILLCCRQIAETIFVITCEGRDIIKEVEKFENRLEEFQDNRDMLRRDANSAYQESDFTRAHSLYTVSISAYSPLDCHLYRNRSLCYMKMQKYDEAYQDGLRAVVLNDTWVKAYHVYTKALIFAKLYKEAYSVNRIACLRCSTNDQDYKQLEAQREQLEKFKEVEEILKKKKQTNVQKQQKKESTSSSDDDLDPDDDDYEDCTTSDDDLARHLQFHYFHKQFQERSRILKVMESIPKKEREKIIRKKKKKDQQKEAEEELERKRKTLEEKKKRDRERVEQIENNKKKKEEKQKKADKKKEESKQKKEEEAEKKRFIAESKGSFNENLVEAYKSYSTKKYSLAVKNYDSALDIMNTVSLQELRVSKDDMCVLLYARGFASINQMIPCELNSSQKYFQRIINEFPAFSRITMAYYGLGYATYYLNNFQMSKQHIAKAKTLLRVMVSQGILTWPGTTEEMEDCQHTFLSSQLSLLEKNCDSPPTPMASCVFKDCRKHYHRKQIYHTDLNFDGFLKVFCHLSCRYCFHLKCWTRFKQDLKKGSDENVLEMTCVTPDCNGIIHKIIRIDEFGMEKYKIPDPKNGCCMLKSLENKSKKVLMVKRNRMSKSERNMEKAFLKLTEKKSKRKQKQELAKRTREQKTIDQNLKEKPEKEKPSMSARNFDFSKATPYFKNDDLMDDFEIKKYKRNKKNKNNKPSAISLREFLIKLPGYQENMTLLEIQNAIEETKLSNEPFEIPEKLYHEIIDFECSIGWSNHEEVSMQNDMQKMTAMHLLRYFEDFFIANGPMKQDDILFQEQLKNLSIDMQEIIFSHHESLVEFLASNDLFVYIPPYIGTPEHYLIMVEMSKDYNERKTEREASKNINNQDADGNKSKLSPFAQEFYALGEIKHEDFPEFLVTSNEDNAKTKPMNVSEFENVISKMSDNSFDNNCLELDDIPYLVGLYGEDSPEDCSSNHSDAVNSCYQARGSTSSLDTISSSTSINKRNKANLDQHKNGNKKVRDDDFIESPKHTTEEDKTGNENEKIMKDAFTITEDVVVRPKSKTKAKFSQTEFPTRSIHTQTKGKDELTKAKEGVRRLQDRVSELEDELTKSKKTFAAKEKKMAKDILDIKSEKEVLASKINVSKHSYEADVAKLAQERKTWQDKIAKLNETAENSKKEAAESNRAREKMEVGYTKCRKELLTEKLELEEKNNELYAKLEEVTERVKKSELMTLETREKVALHSLQKAKHECQQISKDFETRLAPMIRSNDPNVTFFVDARNKWIANTDECTKRIAMVESHFIQQKQQIKNGHSLVDLPIVPIPAPPPSAPTLRQVEALLTKKMTNNINGFSGQILRPQSSNIQQMPLNFPAKSTLSGLNPVANRNGALSPMNAASGGTDKLNKLISLLQKEFQHISRSKLIRYISEVRLANKNTLSGLEYREILRRVKIIATAESKRYEWNSVASQSSGNFTNFHDEVEAICVICYDPLSDKNVRILDCNHRFHSDCIDKWLEKQKTCPNCRKYTNEEGLGSMTEFLPPGLLELEESQ